jgi:RNA polymerase sigma factor (sigma-70 family)
MVSQPNDAQLWERAVEGDAEAFGFLFERHARTVYNYCFRQCGDWSIAEDLTSAVFLEAWRRRGSLKITEETPHVAWLLGVALNLLRNQRRALRRYEAALGRIPPPPEGSDIGDDVAARLDDERRAALLMKLARQLPRRQRDVLMLCDWTGLTYQEAAFALDTPVGTVRSRLFRARRRLREMTAGDEPPAKHTYSPGALAHQREEPQ